MEIRPLIKEDYEALIRLWQASGLSHRPKGRDERAAILKQMEQEPRLFIGAFERGVMVGSIIASHDTRKGWINRLAVHPDHRRRGIAVKLVEEAEDALRKKGFKIFATLIEGVNPESKALFERCGYYTHDDIVYVSKRDSQDI